MKYLSLLIRLAIIILGIYMIVKNQNIENPNVLIGSGFLLIGVFISMLAVFGGKSIRCPFVNCEGENCKK